MMRAHAQRPEHIIAAAWASRYLRERGVAVAHVRAAGVTVDDSEMEAAALRGRWLGEPRKEHLLTKLYKPLIRAHDAVVDWWRGDREQTLALPPPRTSWLPENIRDSVKLEIAVEDGRHAVIDVPFVRRVETMSLIGMSSAVTLGAAASFLPALGTIWLIPGVIIAGTRAALGYLRGDVASGNAALATGVKLAIFCAVDCVPVVANATFTATLARTRSAFERYRAGEDLIDTARAEKELEALTPSRQLLLTHAVETPLAADLRHRHGHVPAVAARGNLVRP